MRAEQTDTALERLWREVEIFQRQEVVLLQKRAYRSWLAMISPNIQYRVPTLSSRPTGRDAQPKHLGFYDEDRRMLEARVTKLESKLSWVENPPSRLRYFVQLLDVQQRDADAVVAISNVVLFQNRWNLEQYYCGERTDVLEYGERGLLLRERVVLLDREQLGAHGLSVFF